MADNGPNTLEWIIAAGVAGLVFLNAWLASLLSKINNRLDAHGFMLRAIIKEEREQMTTLQDFKDSVTAAREDLANIAADESRQTALIEQLQGQISAGGMTAEDEAAALAEIESLKADLKAAADAIPE